jgi:subtilisin family serine protease
MAERGAPVIVLSLVGPSNPIVAKAIKAAQARGATVVAAVGNSGPAARPLFPAAYEGVIGVTGVDPKNRALLEAGRGTHVAFAAPGADVVALNSLGNPIKVRGTSFAAPLVAGRLWSVRAAPNPRLVLEREAVDLGRPGRDPVYGQGLLCGNCR